MKKHHHLSKPGMFTFIISFMKKIHHTFISHLRSYRTFNFMFFTFLLFITSLIFYLINNSYAKEDLLEKAFEPAMSHETIINLWAGKNAVGNEILREGVGVQDNLWIWCMINGQHVSKSELEEQMSAAWYSKSSQEFCEQVLGWDNDTPVLTKEAPLLVRITKFMLRITMVLAVTMVIYNGIMWIIESAKGGDVKDAKKNITFIIIGILIALMSLGIINLISSITVSSLGTWDTSDTYNWHRTSDWTNG